MLNVNINTLLDESRTDYYASIAETGIADISARTWANARKHDPVLAPDEIPKARKYFGSLVPEWGQLPDDHIQALFIQQAFADIQELGWCNNDWKLYQSESEAGRVSGNLFEHNGQLCIEL